MTQSGTEAAPRRRQARGERRIAELLDAAGAVFAEFGYSATTTNAIAARAGVSPGTLYQYFPNKDAMADALAERFAVQLHELTQLMLVPGLTELPLDQLLERVLEPLYRFHVENPACPVLFMGPDVPQRLADAHAPLHAAMVAEVTALIAALAPQLSAETLNRAAHVTAMTFKGLLPLIMAVTPEERPAMHAEVTRVFLGYITLVIAAPGP
ncbi:TetR/AcrR family transcriptional regulator [Streptacidiphilus sp. EB129]|uniref:TetR/AcrR family transcriptional regulator n=1 Tax=Streptacidiphilus sp. EB129 TaxID=3156262 RepID=UPI0035190636